MAIGTLFTLFVVPSIYILIAKDRRRVSEQSGNTQPFAAVPEGAAAE